MNKIISFASMIVLCLCLLTACSCEHDWLEANCLDPKRCSRCDATEGSALGHDWLDATCEHPQLCSRCNATEGSALDHDWLEATCDTHRVCKTCSKKGGTPLGHKFVTIEKIQQPTCTSIGISLQKCERCGQEREITLKYRDHEYITSRNRCTVTKTCENCDYRTQVEDHQEWYFSSNYNIDSCNREQLTFYGTVTCKGCRKTKEGHIKYSATEFRNIFCSWVSKGDYDDIARYPEENTNYVMKFSGYILQDCGDNEYRMSTNGRYKDVIYVKFIGKAKGRILEDDWVTVYGEPDMLYTYTSVSGATITIPKFIAYYIDY